MLAAITQVSNEELQGYELNYNSSRKAVQEGLPDTTGWAEVQLEHAAALTVLVSSAERAG